MTSQSSVLRFPASAFRILAENGFRMPDRGPEM